MKYEDVTERVIGCFYHVSNTLGYGLPERLYRRAMVIELLKNGLSVKEGPRLAVFYDGELIGDLVPDILVNDQVIIELKAGRSVMAEHESQLLSYLAGSRYEVGLLLGFCKETTIRRKVFDNELKPWWNKRV